MKVDNFDISKKVFIVAEIGNNHEGCFTLAEEMLGKAAESGVDAVKFQTFIPELFISTCNQARLDRIKKFQLSFEQFEKLSKLAKQLGVIFFSTPLDLESAEFLNTIQPVFKIASSDNTFYPLLDKVISFKKPIILSTGLTDIELVKSIREYLINKFVPDEHLALLHCVTAYPTPNNEVNLNSLFTLKKIFPDNVIGYSDHTLNIVACTYAVAMGARIIEKHFTTNKNQSDFRDHQLSGDPEDFKKMVTEIREIETLLGSSKKAIQPTEETLINDVRRSLAASKDLKKGSKIFENDIIWLRPGTGVPLGEEHRIIGRTMRADINKGELFNLTNVY